MYLAHVMSERERPTQENPVGFVFIHGAGLGEWIWGDVKPFLKIPSLMIDFPFRQKESAEQRKSLLLEDYVDEVCKQIESWDVAEIILVAHSIGGVVAIEVFHRLGDRVKGFVAIGAAIPERGGSFLSCLPFYKRYLLSILMYFLGTHPPDSVIREGLCNDLSPEQTNKIIERFVPEAPDLYYGNTSTSPLRNVPMLYIKLTKDMEFGVELQDWMKTSLGAQKMVQLESGHLPMFSQPDLLASHLNDFAETLLFLRNQIGC